MASTAVFTAILFHLILLPLINYDADDGQTDALFLVIYLASCEEEAQFFSKLR
jgi:hypothetical protein